MVMRSTAKAGDNVYVTGSIGDATMGLALRLDPTPSVRYQLDAEGKRYLEGKFSRPHPHVGIIAPLRACASAAIDISDGLMKDFARLCRTSGVGGHIAASQVPLSGPARAIIAAGGASLADLMSGGEDYEVLATVPPTMSHEFERLAAKAGTRVTCIGSIGPASAGISATDDDGAPLIFTKTGWDHIS